VLQVNLVKEDCQHEKMTVAKWNAPFQPIPFPLLVRTVSIKCVTTCTEKNAESAFSYSATAYVCYQLSQSGHGQNE
jgi:hypothetical protein